MRRTEADVVNETEPTPLSTYAAERIMELIKLEHVFREALEEIWESYHFVEGGISVHEDSSHWEKCPGCIAGRALDLPQGSGVTAQEQINLTDLRDQAERKGVYHRDDGPVITVADWDEVLALIDAVEAAARLVAYLRDPEPYETEAEMSELMDAALARFSVSGRETP